MTAIENVALLSRERYDEMQAEIDRLRAEVEVLHAREMRAKCLYCGGVVFECSGEWDKLRAEVESLKASLASNNAYVDKIVSGAAEQVTALRAEVEALSTELLRAENAVDHLRAEVAAYRDAATARDRNEEALRAEVEELRALLNEVRSQYTRDDDLPDDLLPRIDAAMKGRP